MLQKAIKAYENACRYHQRNAQWWKLWFYAMAGMAFCSLLGAAILLWQEVYR